MSDAIRNVIMQVAVKSGGGFELPDFVKANGAAAQYFKMLENGFLTTAGSSGKMAAGVAAAADEVQKKLADVSKTAVITPQVDTSGIAELHEWYGAAADELGKLAATAGSLTEVTMAVEAYGKDIQQAFQLDAEQTSRLIEGLSDETLSIFNEAETQRTAVHSAETAKRVAAQKKAADEAAAAAQALTDAEAAESVKRAALQKKAAADAKASAQQSTAAWLDSMTQFAGAGAQVASMLSNIKLLGAGNAEIEELARTFVEVQATIGIINSGSSGLKQLNEGFTKLQGAATAAQVSLAATGGTATATQAALIRLAPAAAAAQAALGPISLILAGISVAVVGVQLAASFFGDDLPDDTKLAEDALASYNRKLQDTQMELAAVSQALAGQNELLNAQWETQKLLKGDKLTAKDIGLHFQDQMAAHNTKIAQDYKAAFVRAEATVPEEVRMRLIESDRQIRGLQSQLAEMQGVAFYDTEEGRREKLGVTQRLNTAQFNREGIMVESGLRGLLDLSKSGLQDPSDIAAGAKSLTPQMRAEIDAVTAGSVQEPTKYATDGLRTAKSQLADEDRKLGEIKSKREKAEADYQREIDLAYRLDVLKESDPQTGAYKDLQKKLASPRPMEALEALSPYLTPEKQQDMRGLARDGLLTSETIRREFEDASETEAEQKELSLKLAELRTAEAKVKETRTEMLNVIDALTTAINRNRDEMQQVQRALQQ